MSVRGIESRLARIEAAAPTLPGSPAHVLCLDYEGRIVDNGPRR